MRARCTARHTHTPPAARRVRRACSGRRTTPACAAPLLAGCALIPFKEYLHLLPITDRLVNARDAIRSLLLNAPWCRGVGSKDVDAMAFAFRPAFIEAGTEIVTLDEEVSHLTLVLSGSIKVGRHRARASNHARP